MKRAFTLAALLAVVAAALLVARADAILFGAPDGNDHKGVGYVVFYDAGYTPIWRCTGSLVSTRVLLTAGHCAGRFFNASGAHTPVLAQVWFDHKPIKAGDWTGSGSCAGFKGWPCTGGDSYGAPIPHPDYRAIELSPGTEDIVHDLGVVLLAKQQNKNAVLPLADVGTLDRTPPRTTFTVVGFGTQSVVPPPVDQRQRLRGSIGFYGIDPDDASFADFTNDQAHGSAVCVGDSGAPVLSSDGAIVAVVSLIDTSPNDSPYGDGFCQGIGFHYRTDTVEARDFLAAYGVGVGGDDAGHGHHGGGKQGRDVNDD